MQCQHLVLLWDISLQIQVCQDRNGRASHHAIRFLRHQMPYGQFSLFPINPQISGSNAWHHIAQHKRGEWGSSTIGVPKAQRGEIRVPTCLSPCHTWYRIPIRCISPIRQIVSTSPVSIHVVPSLRSHHEVIHCRVENPLVLFLGKLCVDASQFLIPCCISLLAFLLKVPHSPSLCP